MDPFASKKPSKDGKWEFPKDVSFPMDVRVLLKLYKVAEDQVGGTHTKYLNTKVIKVEASLEEEDLYNKSSLLAAIERDCNIKNLSAEESIQNPKIEVSIKRQDSGEIFTVTKMGFVVKRLEKLKDRSDTILVEVKEQVISFQPNKPTIKIMINNVPQNSEESGRWLDEVVVKKLNSGLKEFENSSYDRETKRIVCGRCSIGVKPRHKGAAKTIITYFQENHFKTCGNSERKRKAKQQEEEHQKEKKRKETEKMDQYWSALRSKTADTEDISNTEEEENNFEDPDLAVEGNDGAEIFGSSSTSTG